MSQLSEKVSGSKDGEKIGVAVEDERSFHLTVFEEAYRHGQTTVKAWWPGFRTAWIIIGFGGQDEDEADVGPTLRLCSGQALIVAGWQQPEQARRHVQPWENRILSTGSTGWRQALQRWAGAPSGVLFCTPAVLAGGDGLIGAVAQPVTMVLLEPSARAETTLTSLWQRCERLTVVDVCGMGVRTWSRIDVPRFGLLDANQG